MLKNLGRLQPVLIVLFCLFTPGNLLAAEGEGGWGWIETVGRWFNLLILLGGIAYLAKAPLQRYFQERASGIRLQMEEAAKARAEAAAKLEQIESRLENLDRELEAIRNESRKEAELERRRIIGRAEAEAEKIVALAGREIDGLSKAARKDLKAYAAALAVELAEQRISRQMGRSDEDRLFNSFLSDLRSRTGSQNP